MITEVGKVSKGRNNGRNGDEHLLERTNRAYRMKILEISLYSMLMF